jgi:hypothetical protein
VEEGQYFAMPAPELPVGPDRYVGSPDVRR